jgi:predicted unusual protein kinase regulating ubiquinone biosynthesis (AarF/ABC1/UbiB family)
VSAAAGKAVEAVQTGVFSRSRSMLAMAAGVARHELSHRVRSSLSSSAERLARSELATRIEQAKLVAESLGRLKGAVMKAGQLVSLDASEFLPPEAVEILSKLQGEAEPVAFDVIRAVLASELGEEGLARLEGLETRAAASASIGQVHRATVDGARVAVKVQYPGIAESIDADIALLEKLGTGWLTLARRDIDASGLFEELRSILHLEADYDRERTYLERYRELASGDPRYHVPRAYADLSTRRVLTMSWEDGLPLGAWVRAEPSIEARVRFAEAVLDLYCLEFFRWGVVQTDPNYGNFLVDRTRGPDGGALTLLDFGATLEYEPEFRVRYTELLRTIARGDRAGILDAGVAFDILDPREDQAVRDLFVEMMEGAMEPFHASRQPFVFRDAEYAARSRDVITRFTRGLRYSPPPRHLIFLHRKLGGLFQMLKRLDVTLDLRPYWDQMVG